MDNGKTERECVSQIISLARESGFKEDRDIIYVGTTVSSIISSLNCSKEHIVYLYHGVGDYLREAPTHSFVDNLKNAVKSSAYEYVLSRYTCVKNWPWMPKVKMNTIYSLCKNESCSAIHWVDSSKFESVYIKEKLNNIINIRSSHHRILFLPLNFYY